MRWECDPWEPYHYPIYSTRYISEVDAEVKQTEDRLRWPGSGEGGGGRRGGGGETRGILKESEFLGAFWAWTHVISSEDHTSAETHLLHECQHEGGGEGEANRSLHGEAVGQGEVY